ncbi:MAG TPA: DUF1906 domain-containing protein [Actinocrinis sp.]|uniref:DUF1906 domain-containing protein n=1 Tax=Actinocrinis sp. TaxID=1920516 RepID=UPI002D52DC9F|nr:DUF1906 domain-containing protein [Actinocrinis sp.]HZU55397.1 DUF1906 domain-containing protein [Actinocrinis sp.]
MALRSTKARWCTAAAAVCAVVCLSLPSAFAEDHLADAAAARTQARPPADQAAFPDFSGLPAVSGLPVLGGLTTSALMPDLFVSSSAFKYIKRTQSRIYTGNGFDACTAPSLPAMTAWQKSSGYHALGIYIGGLNRACAQGNLTASWVGSVVRMGWHLAPVYVGRQAPCSRLPHLKLIDPKTATAQAVDAADDAANRAAALGIARGSAIYFDLESYPRKNAACTNTALSYLGTWTQRMHAHGYLAGFYSSAGSGITDLVAAGLPGHVLPDALWIARWDNKSTVQDAAVPSRAWTPHQRIKQFAGAHKESYGGVALNVDKDFLDGPVARLR